MRVRNGFTMVEVIVSLVLLSIAVLGLQLVAASMLRQTSVSQVRLSAAQLAEDRVDLIKLEPNYGNLSSYVATENNITGFPRYTRRTTLLARRDSTVNGITDFKRITVAVTAPGLSAPIIRNVTVGAP